MTLLYLDLNNNILTHFEANNYLRKLDIIGNKLTYFEPNEKLSELYIYGNNFSKQKILNRKKYTF